MMIAKATGMTALDKPPPLILGQMIFGKGAGGPAVLTMGLIWHLLNGALLGAVFYYSAAYGVLFNLTIGSAVTFGVLLWLLFNLIILPLSGQGFFGSKTKNGLFKTTIMTFMAHVIYGFSLGYLLGVLL